jgi:hypothetical protein
MRAKLPPTDAAYDFSGRGPGPLGYTLILQHFFAVGKLTLNRPILLIPKFKEDGFLAVIL